MTSPSWIRFIIAVFAGTLFVWAVLALWIIAAPLTILTRGDATLLAKDDLIERCPATEIAVFGDSRAEAGIDPRLIGVPTANFAHGNGLVAEDYYRVARLLKCGGKPRLVILSYNLTEYTRINPLGFWHGTVIAHLLTLVERDEILRRIEESNRDDAFRQFPDEAALDYGRIPPRVKNLLYEIYFPPLYSAPALHSLESGIVFRYQDNMRVYDATSGNHGRSEYHPMPRDFGRPARDAWLWSGTPDPVIDHYLREILSLLLRESIPAMMLFAPVNETTYSAISKPAREQLLGYLAGLRTEFPNLVLADTDLPRWPDEYFGDVDLHLNARGVAIVAGILSRCVRAASGPAEYSSCGLAVPRTADRVE